MPRRPPLRAMRVAAYARLSFYALPHVTPRHRYMLCRRAADDDVCRQRRLLRLPRGGALPRATPAPLLLIWRLLL